MSKIQYAGEFKLEELKIISSSGNVVDLSKSVMQIDLYESIFKNSISGSILIADTNNMVNNLPIIGQEYITLKVSTPSIENEAIDFTKHVFQVFQINARSDLTKGTEIYELHLTTSEFLRGERTKVSKSFTNTPHAIVESVLRDPLYLNSKKSLFVEESDQIKRLISPLMSPFRFISRICKDSFSTNGSPHYLFYETTKGFNFRTIENLYQQPTIGTYDTGDIGTLESKTQNIEVEMKRIIEFSRSSNSDMAMSIMTGMLASKIVTHDIYNKTFGVKNYGYFNDFTKYSRLNYNDSSKDNPVYNEIPLDEFGNTLESFDDAVVYVHPTSITPTGADAQHMNSDNTQNYSANRVADSLLTRRAKLAELSHTETLNLILQGNTTLFAGRMIDVNLTVTGIQHDTNSFDKFYSGKYLITDLKHTFNFVADRHEIAVSCAKETLNEKLPLNRVVSEPKPKSGKTIIL